MQVVVIGSSKLGELYAQALEAHDILPRRIDGEIASLEGLKVLHNVQFGGSTRDAT